MRVKLLLLGLLLLGLGIQGNSLGASSFSASTSDASCTPKFRQIHQIEKLQIAFIECKDNADEVVIIVNGSKQPIDLFGYKITNSRGQPFVFERRGLNEGCCTINAYDVIRIHSGKLNANLFEDPRDLHWLNEDGRPRVDEVWNDNADMATLCNRDGERKILDTYEYGEVQNPVQCPQDP